MVAMTSDVIAGLYQAIHHAGKIGRRRMTRREEWGEP